MWMSTKEGIRGVLVGDMLSICSIGEGLMAIENTDEWYANYLFYSWVSIVMMWPLIAVASVIYYIGMAS